MEFLIKQKGGIGMAAIKSTQRKMKTNNSNQKQNVYVDGNTVRKLDSQPQRQRTAPVKKTVHRNQKAIRSEKALPINRLSVAILAAASIVTVVLCVQYVQLQSEITTTLKSINAKTVKLADLKEHNNETDKRINSFIDLNYIYKVATEELGMRYATKEQILYYENSGSEYVRQYQDIPEEADK